jgi:DNA helicase II / ATP-dependent DNA helicase PcrA
VREQRIFGPPGTGKTTTLVAWITRAAESFGGAVVVVSFTKAAAKELVGRGVPIEDRRIGTLHSLCKRALGDVGTIIDGGRSHGQGAAESKRLRAEWNANVYDRWQIKARNEDGDEDDEGPVVKRTGETWANYVCVRNKLTPIAQWHADIQELHLEFARFCGFNHATDFTGLVERVLDERVPLPYSAEVLFCDEAQDCTKLELSVLRMWGESCRHWVLAGDDQQAIYGFRGATPDAFLDPPLPESQKTFLRQSYRLHETVRTFAMAYGSTMRRYEPKDYQAVAPGGSVLTHEWSGKHAGRTVDCIEEEIKQGRETMVLAHCGYMLSSILRLARARGIPFHNPYRQTRGDWNPLRGACSRLAAFIMLTVGKATWADVGRWVDVVDVRATEWPRGAKSSALQIAKESPDEIVYAEDFERTFGHAIPDSARWLLDRLLPSASKAFIYAEQVMMRGIDALTATPKVVVGTIHSVKGGQADTVILIPDVAEPMWLERFLDHGEDDIKRLMYVGMTRARDKLHILAPMSPCYDRDLFQVQVGVSNAH